MKCRTRRFNTRPNVSGMTLPEMMIAVLVASIVFGAVATLSMFGARSFVAMGNYADLDQASRNALDIMSRDIRQTKGLNSFNATKLVFQDSDTNTLTYVYDPSAKTLTRLKGTSRQILLKQCDYLNFDISQRNPSNQFSFYPATSASMAKLIDVSWKCSRTILGAKVNTESVQTAKIVIRN
jgi:prepilin-type N-terminal cleavage/methylation domain-containing protein